jgi:hypothetical protein
MVTVEPDPQKPSFGQTALSFIGMSDAPQNYATQLAARQKSVNQIFDAVDEYQKTTQPLAEGKQLGVEKFPATASKSAAINASTAAERAATQGGMPGGGTGGAKKSENKKHKDRYWIPESVMDESEFDHGLPTPVNDDDPDGRAAEIDRQRRERMSE